MSNALPKFADLSPARRTEPCQEYPGIWLVFSSGNNEAAFPTFREAFAEGAKRAETEDDVSICWECSDHDVRQGKVWFTGFYRHGKFNVFGQYVT